MSIGLLFWIILITGFIFMGYYEHKANLKAWAATDLIYWILFALLGWEVFGPAIHH